MSFFLQFSNVPIGGTIIPQSRGINSKVNLARFFCELVIFNQIISVVDILLVS